MRIVHPITSQPLPMPRHHVFRKMPTPSRLPSVYPTQPSALQLLLRLLGIGR